MKKYFFVPLLAVTFFMCACNSNALVEKIIPDDTTVTELYTDPGQLNLKVGETKYISASYAATIDNPTVTWSVRDPQSILDVQYIDNHGGLPAACVTALAEGSATVTAQCGQKFASTEVTVSNSSTPIKTVTSVTLSPKSKTVEFKSSQVTTFDISGQVLPIDAPAREIGWSSSNTAVATVEKKDSSTATVTIKGVGNTVITGSAGGKSDTCTLLVLEEGQTALTVGLDKATATLKSGESLTLNATANKDCSFEWSSSNQGVATVSSTGVVNAYKPGSATITVTARNGQESDTAQCVVTVPEEGGGGDYEEEIAKWSQAGHLYLHYKRELSDYDNWAVWMWQKLPKGLEGSLWGSTHTPRDFTAMTTSWMKNSEVGGVGDGIYSDKYGQVCDIDLTRDDIVDGRDATPSPIVGDWDNLKNCRIGFLIVDETKMNGGTHWTSDGGIEAYIKNLDQKFPNKQDSYLHIFCTEGSVTSYTTSSGQPVDPNPTIDDQTGQYVSKNDITDLKADAFKGGVSTSETFLEDKPGTGYQIFVPSFADGNGDGMGDLRGIINKLDYLDNLGIKTLWLTPIQESDSYHGYDVTDYYKIDSKFGTMEDYQELLYKAHQKGMKVLMDMVINHTSKNNVLFTKSQKAVKEVINGKEINYRDMYLWKFKGDSVREWDGVEPATANAEANYKNVPVESSSDWYKDGTSNYYYYGKFGSGMAELNYSCQATRNYMTDMCKYWLSFGLDGFRLDAIKHIYLCSELDPATATKYKNDNITYDVGYKTAYDEQIGDYVTTKNDYSYDRDLNVMFWKQFTGVIKAAYPNCYFVGENFDGWNQRVSYFYESMDSQFDFSLYYALNEKPTNSIGSHIKETIGMNDSFRHDSIAGPFTSNHDIARLLNHAGACGDPSHTSEISNSNKDIANKRARYMAAATILMPGLSWIYYGDELGMSGNLNDIVPDSSGNLIDDHGNNKDRWYRQPMRWGTTQGQDMVPIYVFSKLEVNWDKYNRTIPTATQQVSDPNSMFSYFKALCNTKNHNDYPTYGYIVWCGTCGAVDESMAFQVSDGARTANVFINNTDASISVPGTDRGSALIGGSVGASQDTVPAHGFAVVKA